MVDNGSPRVVLQTPSAGKWNWTVFESPREVLVAHRHDQVMPVLTRATEAADRGQVAAGFVAYEAAPAFDPALQVHAPTAAPLAWFALFSQSSVVTVPPVSLPFAIPDRWITSLSEDQYRDAVETIRRHIAEGDTYQINFTLRLTADFDHDPWTWFLSLCRGQHSECCAYVDTGELVLCSASPELFFELAGDQVRCKPMKGTAARGRTTAEDEQQATWLRSSRKNQAENVMIVDMVRNDLGRIAEPGTVQVTRLWELERYPSLFQLTSTVEARTAARLEQVFAALFPCASITGAPKIRAMEIIRQLETTPRGVYTGAIGRFGPGRQARFSVAIRTAQIDRSLGRATYGTGGGIVWDSVPAEEWRECRTKALVLESPRPEFELLETLLWEPGLGYFLLERHLDRMRSSAHYFDFSFDVERARDVLADHADRLPRSPHRVRLLAAAEGRLRVGSTVLQPAPEPWRLVLASEPIDSSDRFLFHKTTHRQVYDAKRQLHPDADDVVLWNRDGEVTETTLANLVARFAAKMVTPKVECGLLAGTFRGYLLERREIFEETISTDELRCADQLWLINSVRRWVPAVLIGADPPGSPETRSRNTS